MISYYLILFLVFIFGVIEQYDKKHKKVFVVFLFVFLLVSLGASISRGDYYSYHYYFSDIDLSDPTPKMELGFFYFSYLIKFFTEDSFYLFFYSSVLCFILKFFSLKRLNRISGYYFNYGYFFCLYFAIFLIYLDIGSIRFAIATSFLLLALTYLLEGKNKKYYLLILLGMSFHMSVIVALVIPTLFHKRKSMSFFMVCLGVGVLVFILFHSSFVQNILNSNYYLSKIIGYSRFGSVVITFQLVKRLALLFIFYWIFKKEIKNRESLIYLTWVVSVFSMSMWSFFMVSQVTVSRYLLMFGICEPIMLILMFKKFNLSSKKVYSSFLVMYVVLNYSYSIVNNSNDVNLYLPYKNAFLGDKQPYQSRETMYLLKQEK